MLKQAATPWAPLFVSPHRAPIVCAQSSMTAMPSESAAFMRASMSAMCPRMCESISTRASPDSALRARSSRSMTRSSVISTSTALPPAAAMAPGTGGQREAVGQHGLAGREAEGAQRGLQRIAPRRAGETETCAHVRRELVLQKDGLRRLAVDDVVPMQPSRAHDGDGTLDALLGYRRLLREVSVESARHRVLHHSRDRGGRRIIIRTTIHTAAIASTCATHSTARRPASLFQYEDEPEGGR